MTSVLKPNDYFPSGDLTVTLGKYNYTLGGRTHYTYESIGRERTSYVATRTLTETGGTELITQQDSLAEVVRKADFPWRALIERTILSEKLYDLLIKDGPYLKDVVRFSKPAPSELAETLEWLKTPRGIVRLRYVSGLERPYVFDRWSGSVQHESLADAIAAVPTYDLHFSIDHTTPKPFVEQLRVSLLGRWVREVDPSGCPAATRLQSQLTLLSTDEEILATIQSVSLKDLYTIWEDTNTRLSFRILCKTFVDCPMTTKETPETAKTEATPITLSPATLEWLKTPRGDIQLHYTDWAVKKFSRMEMKEAVRYDSIEGVLRSVLIDHLAQLISLGAPEDLTLAIQSAMVAKACRQPISGRGSPRSQDFYVRVQDLLCAPSIAYREITQASIELLNDTANDTEAPDNFRKLCQVELQQRVRQHETALKIMSEISKNAVTSELSPETLEWLKTPRGWAQVCYTGGAYPYSTPYSGDPKHYATFSALMDDYPTLDRDFLEQGVELGHIPSDLALICKERLFRNWVNDSSAAKYEADLPDDIREFLNRMRGFSLSDMLAALQDTEGTMLSKCADGLKVHRDFRSLCNLERRSRRNNEVQESTKVKVETMTKKAAMDMIKEDGTDAAVRIGATQLTRAAQMSLSGILKAQGMKGPQIKAFIAFLNTDLGKICIKGALAGMLTYGPEIISEDPRGQLLAKEFRIQTMADSGNLIADLLMENLGPALMTTLASIPEPQKTRVVDEKPAVQHEDPEIQVAAKTATA